jgi:hypothetical protein
MYIAVWTVISIITVILVILALKDENRKFRECTVPIEAEIIDVKKERNIHVSADSRSYSYNIYVPIVEYRYEGEDYIVKIDLDNTEPKRFIVGDTVVIQINPDDPSEYNFKPSENWQYGYLTNEELLSRGLENDKSLLGIAIIAGIFLLPLFLLFLFFWIILLKGFI